MSHHKTGMPSHLVRPRSDKEEEQERAAVLRNFLFPGMSPNQKVTARAVAQRLKKYVGKTVVDGNRTLTLRAVRDPNTNSMSYYVETGAVS